MMSGVMLKTAIYGLLRVSFDLLHSTLWWWGVVALAVGLITALFGVLYSTVPKRHETAAGLFLDREHRPDRRRLRPDADFPCLPHGVAGGTAMTAVLYTAWPFRLQEPAVPV